MALIKCPECGKEISDKASACPNCGCPIGAPATITPVAQDNTAEIEKYLDLATKGIQGQSSEQVAKYCDAVLRIDPQNAKAWELEARGILFNSTLNNNNIMQAIAAAANAVEYTTEDKAELAKSLYSSILGHISGLLQISIQRMPVVAAPQYVALCMNYWGNLIAGIPYLPKEFIEKELFTIDRMDSESKSAIMPKKRLIYAAHATKPAWADQFRTLLKAKGRI